MDIQEEIIKAMQIIVKKEIEKLNISRDVASVIRNATGESYEVLVDGSITALKCKTNLGTLKQGDRVWVHIPNNDIKQAFIFARR